MTTRGNAPFRSGARRGVEIVKGLASVATLAAMTAGFPIALWAATRILAPGAPSPSAISTLIREDDTNALLVIMLAVAWIGWIVLIAALLIEIPAAVRGVNAPRMPALGGLQHTVAALVTAVAALLPAAGVASAAVPAATTAVTAPRLPVREAGVTNPATAQNPAATRTVTVARGDTLWGIAEHELGDGTAWHAIADLNDGRIMAGGAVFHRSEPIQPGWVLLIPGTTARPHDNPTNAAPAQSPSPHISAPRPTTGAATASSAGASSAATAWDQERRFLTAALGISSISAAAMLVLLDGRRRTQQNRRAIGQRIAMPSGRAARTEHRLRAVADPAGRSFVDRALRTLAARSAATGSPIPEISAALLHGDGLELRLAGPCPPIAPFTAVGESVWWCPPDAGGLLPPEQVEEYPAPYPALVAAGTTDDGSVLMLDLEHYGVLEIDGDREQATGVVRSLGLELPWTQYVSVATAGIELSADLSPLPIRSDPPERVLPAFEQWAASASQVLPDGAGTEPLRRARIEQTRPDATAPRVLLGVGATPQAAERLRAATGLQPRPAAAAVIAVDGHGASGGNSITVDSEGRTTFDDLGLDVMMQTVDDEQYEQLVSVMQVTKQPAAADPAWAQIIDTFVRSAPGGPSLAELFDAGESAFAPALVTAPPDPAARINVDAEDEGFLALLASGPGGSGVGGGPQRLRIGVLGPVQIPGASGPDTDPHLLELAAYISLNPARDLAEAAADLGLATQTLAARLAALRDLIGTGPDGSDLLPITADGRLAFDSRVDCEWTVFQKHCRSGRFAQAIALIRGEPLPATRPGRYRWAEPHRQAMVSTIIDISHTLAETYLGERDFASARLAITQGLLGVPYAEVLWRDMMRLVAAENGPNNTQERTDLLDDFTDMCDRYGIEASGPTLAVLNQMTAAD